MLSLIHILQDGCAECGKSAAPAACLHKFERIEKEACVRAGAKLLNSFPDFRGGTAFFRKLGGFHHEQTETG